jgi:hypothetical protein
MDKSGFDAGFRRIDDDDDKSWRACGIVVMDFLDEL